MNRPSDIEIFLREQKTFHLYPGEKNVITCELPDDEPYLVDIVEVHGDTSLRLKPDQARVYVSAGTPGTTTTARLRFHGNHVRCDVAVSLIVLSKQPRTPSTST